ncbi:hypothetical protein GGR51DRAFT_554118 [Nemania sp. FL0031]|nr:hypothetical protein GGR51DRAFT_554118 [Nemania sp. FL0031]
MLQSLPMIARPTRQIIAPLRIRILTSSTQPLLRSRAAQHLPRARFSSTHEPKPEGSLNHKTFYKTFGRPIAKVFLMAIFTYQLAYYFWVKMEQDEIRAEMEGAFVSSAFLPALASDATELIANGYLLRRIATISDLEARIEQLERTTP